MGLAAGLDVKRVGSSLLHELVILGENQSRSNIKDVGVGVSQVLPVIVACLFAPSGHTVIVEEPESHLHPLAQSTLAELFIKVSKQRNIQIIAETHSEHLFRRMQTLIAKEEIPANQCAPYFVERMDRESRLQPLELDIYGRIKNWPKMFFGDSLGETKAQTDLMLAKLKEQKNNNAQAD
jgi:predicted ATPase